MYESYWNLTTRPFQPRCSVDRLYPGSSHSAALLRLRYCFDNGGALAVLLGESGMGKTSLLRRFAGETDRWSPFAHVLYSGLSPRELLRQIAMELRPIDTGLREPGQDEWLAHIRQFLLDSAERGHSAVVALDDAHQLSDAALEQTIAPLLTLGECDPRIRMSVVLSGHPRLLPQLQRHQPIAERTEVLSVMTGWSCEETADYVARSLIAAGASEPVFTDDAIRCLQELSGGNPRRVNRLCDLALLVGCGDRSTRITPREIQAVGSELIARAA